MWLEYIKPYTKNSIINNKDKRITLIHPHFKPGKSHLRTLLKLIKQNQFTHYRVECVGFCSIKGALILKMIQRVLKKYDNIKNIDLRINLETSIYNLTVQFN